jgi:uncharacterized membrane protein YhaH (DUF805 family)
MDWQSIDWKHLLTSLHGRIDRLHFWAGFAASFVIALVVGFIGAQIAALVPAVGWIVALLLSLAALFPAVAVVVKRLHDRDKPDAWAAIFFGPYILSTLAALLGITAVTTILSIASLAAFLYMAYDLGYLEGTPGPNAYGPAPAKGAAANA